LSEDSASDDHFRRATENLYRAFARYPTPGHVEGCPHCVSDADHALLFSKPLRELGPHELTRYAFKAMSTWGDEDDFRHFLPRIFELLASDGGDGEWIDPEIAFGKLSYGHWRTWPRDEQDALTTFFFAMWSNVLRHFPHPFEAASCLCCIAQAVDDLGDYLGAWDIAKSLPAARHFASFVEDELIHREPSGKLSLMGAWWERRQKPAEQVAHWLANPARQIEVQQALDAFGSNAEDAKLLSDAADWLASLNRP
jgi:hypothetical protein